MKRLYIALLCILLLIPLAACSQTGMKKPLTFYYPMKYDSNDAPISGISSEVRECADIRHDRIMQLQRYLSGPQDQELYSPFPEGTTVKSMTFGKGRAYITLSDHISQLHGIDLNIACACLMKTVEKMLGVESVELRAESKPIENEPFLIMRTSDFELVDQYADHITS